MATPDVRAYLYDVAEACRLLMRFTQGKGLADYRDDPLLQSAVERQFEIVGEALGQALQTDPGLAGSITGARRIVAFRNRLIHGYRVVSHEMVWSILQVNLPVLAREVAGLLVEGEEDAAPG
jgi:uncharacterized protein with HEPN domain